MSPSASPRWWQWTTVLSIDAPAVSVAWQALFAALAGVHLGWAEPTVVAASVWLGYAADRWFEGWRVAPEKMQTQRHRFYQQHRWAVAAIWLIVASADITISFLQLTPRELLGGTVLLCPTLLYVLSHQLAHRHARWRLPKEICITLLLAGGASVFVIASPTPMLPPLIGPVVLFGALCFVNLALIATWEQEVDATHGQVSLARQFRGAAGLSRTLPWLLTLGAAFSTLAPFHVAPVAAACTAVSAFLLAILDHCEPRMGRRLARVLSDLVLLTPVIPLVQRLAR